MTTKERIASIRTWIDGLVSPSLEMNINLLADVAEAAEAFMSEYCPTEASDALLKLLAALAALSGDDDA